MTVTDVVMVTDLLKKQEEISIMSIFFNIDFLLNSLSLGKYIQIKKFLFLPSCMMTMVVLKVLNLSDYS